MPPVGLFHTFYWEFSDTVVPPVLAPGFGGYPMWQASVVAPSLLGVVGAWIDTRWEQIRWFWSLCRRVHELRKPQRDVLMRVLGLMEHPNYPIARTAVRTTATTLGFNDPKMWKGLSTHMKAVPGRAENEYRHLNACALTRQAGSTMTNPTCNLLVELAYHEYTVQPWR